MVTVPSSVLVVPSPQFTVIPSTVELLVTVKVTVTNWPVFAGFGVGASTVTVGTHPASTVVIDPVPCPVEPLLSVAVTLKANVPPTV